MGKGVFGSAVVRALAIVFLWSALSVGAAAPAQAQSSGQFRTELNDIRLKMRSLWGEIERLQVKPFYCLPPYPPSKQVDEMWMQAYSARAEALSKEYLSARARVKSFLQGNHELLAQLMVNGQTPLDDRWWMVYDAEHRRMLSELAAKKAALARAPVRNCAPKPKQPTQVADPFRPPSLPQSPSYTAVNFPTVPTHFCSEDEYWKFIHALNAEVERAAENAEKAAKARSEAEQALNVYVQAGRPAPAEVYAARRRTQAEVEEQQKIFDRLAKLRELAGKTKIIDCSKTDNRHGSIGVPGPRLPLRDDMNGRIWHAYGRFEDGRNRCDQALMAASLAELERLAKEAQEIYSGVAESMHGGPFDQADTPENNAYHGALADRNNARRMLDRARAAQAQDCVPCADPPQPPPPVSQVRTPGVSAEASRQLAAWIEGTNQAFTQLRIATDAKDCAKIRAAMEQVARRFRNMTPLGMSLVPPEIRLAWRVLYLKSLEACRPAEPEQPESILDEIDEVPVIAQAPTDRTSAEILAYHNRLRSEAGSKPLRWDPALAARALQYATVLAATGQMQHASRQGRESERENIVLGRRGDSAMTMARTWGNEKQLYRGGTFPNVCNGDWSTCAHYTQMVWTRTRNVGCGFASGRQFNALVCRYSPPGNQDGQPVIAQQSRLSTLPRRCPPGSNNAASLLQRYPEQVVLVGVLDHR